MQKLIIQASNIHLGGGAVLLADLLNSLNDDIVNTKLLVDSRYSETIAESIEVLKIEATVLGRIRAEFALRSYAVKEAEATFLFFGNLPPLFKSGKHAHLFFQNLILLEQSKRFQFVFKTTIKHYFEKFWLWYGIKNIDTVYVQSATAKRLFLKKFPDSNVKVFGFSNLPIRKIKTSKRSGFLFVAASNPHKNHLNLIKAWILLSEAGFRKKLILTSNLTGEEYKILTEALTKGVDIEIKTDLTRIEVLDLYDQVEALVYPSFTESFGLPLLEAERAGTPIIASELDYVRDLVTPNETFDPNSERSIARAVLRFSKNADEGRTEVVTTEAFLSEILLT